MALGAVVAGCSTPSLQSSEYVTVADSGALPPPTTADLSMPAHPQIIGSFDRIAIDVYGVDTLSRTVQTDANGKLRYPLIGEIDARGLTPTQLAARLETSLTRYVRHPQVLVSIVESANQVFTVDGEVQQAGIFPLSGRITLMQAIARAQGATEFARLSHVVVFRTVGGRRMAALYDLRSIRAGIYQDPEIYAQDVIVVGESQARRIFRDVLQGSTLLTTPIIALIQR